VVLAQAVLLDVDMRLCRGALSQAAPVLLFSGSTGKLNQRSIIYSCPLSISGERA
jgi:hypothetical protein